MFIRWLAAVALAATVLVGGESVARAHCDTLDGPVVTDARAALARGNVSVVLKWVRGSDAAFVREVFVKTMRVRSAGGEARELADRYFFETVVRLHRAGEGEPFTGLKPAGTDPGPAVRATDAALAKRKADGLVGQTTEVVARGIRTRFARLLAAKKRASRSVADGRRYVAAYVDLLHYVERIDALARTRNVQAKKHEAHVTRSTRTPVRTAKR